ncbi:Fanconi anemia core complex-associated protein 20 isoform X2 [Pungitius pungitius]|uniref:Fanconi anemia core complex-associated protein 20 isoform X2 n=1 Tax=Pungitius pungitius TaxID=134920 RepID=UPI0018883A4E|nr:Fanconi anemia core complex-associated protein 20 isoform X2 [Pungitius pungitius]
MSQKHLKSKLKRNKCSVGDEQLVKRSPHAPLSRGPTEETGRSVWWRRECLPVEDNLWALTLKSALLDPGDLQWDPVPDLPHPSTAKELPEHSKPGPDWPATPPASPNRPCRDGEAAPPLQALPQSPRPSFHSSSPGPSSAGGHERRTGGQQEEDTGLVSRRLLTKQATSRGSLQGGEEMHTHVAGDAGGGWLQSCPMCLVVFPDGFTQMDCDGHLAQCLSEVNVDVTCQQEMVHCISSPG